MVVNVDVSETAHVGGWRKQTGNVVYFERTRYIVLQKWISMSSEPHTCV